MPTHHLLRTPAILPIPPHLLTTLQPTLPTCWFYAPCPATYIHLSLPCLYLWTPFDFLLLYYSSPYIADSVAVHLLCWFYATHHSSPTLQFSTKQHGPVPPPYHPYLTTTPGGHEQATLPHTRLLAAPLAPTSRRGGCRLPAFLLRAAPCWRFRTCAHLCQSLLSYNLTAYRLSAGTTTWGSLVRGGRAIRRAWGGAPPGSWQDHRANALPHVVRCAQTLPAFYQPGTSVHCSIPSFSCSGCHTLLLLGASAWRRGSMSPISRLSTVAIKPSSFMAGSLRAIPFSPSLRASERMARRHCDVHLPCRTRIHCCAFALVAHTTRAYAHCA